MKKGLLGTSALIGATALMAGAAGAAEAPTWKLTGNANFQFYWVDQDFQTLYTGSIEDIPVDNPSDTGNPSVGMQDHGWYFGVDEAELQLNVSGTADNGLNYGFKIEINANTTDTKVADEVRLQLSGGWGTLQMGDEDGAEDIMNYGGENLMGATGGFDGDQDDVLNRLAASSDSTATTLFHNTFFTATTPLAISILVPKGYEMGAPGYPTIAGDTSDQTKISYFSPRFSGFQVGASITPTPNNGDDFKADGGWENHIGVGANYDNSFGDLRIRASAVYSAASAVGTNFEDVSAWSVGGIVGWGPFSLGANYTDNGDSGQIRDILNNRSLSIETSYWNVAAGFETGPLYLSAGYFLGTKEWGGVSIDIMGSPGAESEYEHIALTADYTVAPGLGVYAEVDLIDDQNNFGGWLADQYLSNEATIFIMGANVSF